MTTLAILVKSHAPDLPYAERLLESFTRHNVEEIPLHLVVSDEDLALFAHLARENVTIHSMSLLAEHLVDEPVAGFPAGYINQEIVKLSFWELGLADNYFCVDSDAEFVRDFRAADFMADASTPYTFLTEDFELQAEPEYFDQHWSLRRKRLQAIADEIGVSGERLRTVHGHAVFSGRVLKSFRDDFLAQRKWDYADALAIAPYEPTWYNLWLQKDRTIPIIAREPIVKTFHTPTQHLDYILRGISGRDVSRGYLAVVVNSNYSRGDGVVSFADEPHELLASYLSVGQLARSIAYRIVRIKLRVRRSRNRVPELNR